MEIANLKDACIALGVNINDVLLTQFDKKFQIKINAHLQLAIIYKAFILDREPSNFESKNLKYYLKFHVHSKGNTEHLSSVVMYDFDNDTSDASMFRFRSKDDAKYFGTTFKDLFEKYIL